VDRGRVLSPLHRLCTINRSAYFDIPVAGSTAAGAISVLHRDAREIMVWVCRYELSIVEPVTWGGWYGTFRRRRISLNRCI